MIVKREFDPRRVVPYVQRELAIAAGASLVALALVEWAGISEAALPFGLAPVLGTALAIFLAFRNNASAARWNEGAALWAGISSYSRVFARLIVTFTASHRHTPQFDAVRAEGFQQEMVRRQIAWVQMLRLQLRGQDTAAADTANYLQPHDRAEAQRRHNPAAWLLQRQGQRIYDAMADGTLQGFDSFQLEGCLLQLSVLQGNCERLKMIPALRQYGYFTRIFSQLFIVLLPFCLIGALAPGTQRWLVVPLAMVVAFVFAIIERVGAVNEDPFENRIQDVPLTAYSRAIERDLLATLGEQDLPPAHTPTTDGHLA